MFVFYNSQTREKSLTNAACSWWYNFLNICLCGCFSNGYLLDFGGSSWSLQTLFCGARGFVTLL